MNNLAITYKATADLLPYINNAKKHSADQVAMLAASIKEFGFNNPILTDGDNGVIAGHGRLQAAQKLGLETVPTIELSHLSGAQKKAYILADNRLGEVGTEWDMELVNLELEALQGLEFDLSLTGFELELGDEEPDYQGDPDDTPALSESEPVSQRGMVWLCGEHRVMCGDSTSTEDVRKLMSGKQADMVFTDPPYGVSYQSNWRKATDKFCVIKNDEKILDIAPIIEQFSSGWIFVWTSWKVQFRWIEQLSSFGFPSNIVIWHKPGGGIGDLKKTFSSDYETALVWNRGHELCGKRIGSVWTINKDGSSTYVHPTQKPVALAIEAIDKTTNKSFTVLDMFGGSGSTLIACEKTSRTNYSMELDEKYIDVIVKRWQQFTGKDATLENDGRTFNEIASLCP